MTKGDNLTLLEEQAFQMSKCAIALGQAHENQSENPADLMLALKGNLETWVALRTIAEKIECGLEPDVIKNLVQLSQYVADKTFACGAQGSAPADTIGSLVNINLQISEGLLEASSNSSKTE